MIRLQEICDYLEGEMHPSLFVDACPNGLQVEGKEKLQKAATAVSASLATIEEAVSRGVDCLLVHHGLFWREDPFPIVGAKRKKLELLLKNGISLIAYHLPLDAHPAVGNNWKAARDLGWEDLEPFGEYKGVTIGVKGTFSPISLDKFSKKVEGYYDHPAFIAPGGKKEVSSCALISGGAWRSLHDAAKIGVDCFITGSYDEPAWHVAHEEKINFLALGHSATEKIGPKALATLIQNKFALPTEFIDISNPF